MRVKENLSYLKAKKDRPLSYHEISTTIKKQKFPKKGFIQKLYKNSYSTKRSTKHKKSCIQETISNKGFLILLSKYDYIYFTRYPNASFREYRELMDRGNIYVS